MKRGFLGLRQPPNERYDAIVIGAGIGGLTSAALLAQGGLSVLIVEAHYMVGGYCSTFRRKGFTFDAASHFYPLLGNPDTLTGQLMTRLGVETKWVRMDPVDTFHLPDGSVFRVPPELEDYLTVIKTRFPHQIDAIDRFFSRVREAYMAGLLLYFRGRETAKARVLKPLTLRQVLDQEIDDEALKLILCADCPHWGGPPERTSFLFDSMLRLSYFLGNYYPKGSSQAFADDVAARVEAYGGHVMVSTRATKIHHEDGKVTGVELETSRGRLAGTYRVDAPIVVSNAEPHITYGRLLPKDVLDEKSRTMLSETRLSWPCALVHLGFDGDHRARLDELQGYHWEGWDPDEYGRGALRCKIFSPSIYDSSVAPQGKTAVIIQKVIEMNEERSDPDFDWAGHKKYLRNLMVGKLLEVMPELVDKIDVETTATARTSERYTSNPGGAMLGPEMAPDQLGKQRLDQVGPLEGLFNVGHWTRPGGGITPVLVSAERVAEAVLGSKLPQPVPFPTTDS